MIEHQNFFSLALPWNAESDLCCSPQQLSENKFIHTWHIKYSIFFQEVLSMYIYCLSKKSCPFMYTLSYICPRSLDHLSIYINCLSKKSRPFIYTLSYTCLYYLGANADLARDRFQYSHLLVPVFCCIVVNIAPAVPQELSQAGRYTFTY